MSTALKGAPRRTAKRRKPDNPVMDAAKMKAVYNIDTGGGTAAAAAPVDTGRFELIPLDLIEESTTNPRKAFHHLEDLAESIRAHGVVEPVLVRPHGEPNGHPDAKQHYELIAGARRLRASKLAGKTEIPAIVRTLDEKAALEIQVIENEQREDVHPLEQADGYQLLISKHGYDVPTLAAKIGRSETYVYQRLQLSKLIGPARKLFQEEQIHLGHALPISRLQESDQAEIAKWVRSHVSGWQKAAPSVAELRRQIEDNYHLELSAAPWKKDDAELVAAAGACLACPKRSGFNKALFADLDKKDVCTDRACFAQKREAFVQLQIKTLKDKGQEPVRISTAYSFYGQGKKPEGVLYSAQYEEVSPIAAKKVPAKELKTAVVVDGRGHGRVVQIRVAEAGKGSGSGDDSSKVQQRRRQESAKRYSAIRNAVLTAVLGKVKGEPDLGAMRRVAGYLVGRMDFDSIQRLTKRRGWQKPAKTKPHGDRWQENAAMEVVKTADAAELHRFMIECSLVGQTHVAEYSSNPGSIPEQLMDAAKSFRVDVKKIVADAKAAEKAQKKSAPKPAARGGKRAKPERADDVEDAEACEREAGDIEDDEAFGDE
jgi:ParB family chromosome partitioning protein